MQAKDSVKDLKNIKLLDCCCKVCQADNYARYINLKYANQGIKVFPSDPREVCQKNLINNVHQRM